MGPERHRDRRGVARRGGDPERPRSAVRRDEHRPRSSRSSAATPSPRPSSPIRWDSNSTAGCWDSPGSPCGSCCSRSSCRLAAPGGGGRPGIGQLGPRRRRAHDRVRRHLVPSGPGTVLLRARVPLPARGGHGLRRRPRGLQLGTEVRRARELGSYRLEEKLGQGGMGEVWRARHRMLARPAAIKLIRPSLSQDARPGVVGGAAAPVRARSPGRSPASARLTRWSSSISASPPMAPSTTSWSCSTASTPTRCCGASGRSRPSGPSTCSARSATRCPRRSPAVWFTATSSPRTSSSAGTARSTTSSRCWISES